MLLVSFLRLVLATSPGNGGPDVATKLMLCRKLLSSRGDGAPPRSLSGKQKFDSGVSSPTMHPTSTPSMPSWSQPCFDGEQSSGEEGINCGGSCDAQCNNNKTIAQAACYYLAFPFAAAGHYKINCKGSTITGTIPSALADFAHLTEIVLSNNELTGTIPSLGGLTKLTHLDLRANQLNGTVSALDLAQLEWLDLSTNDLTGTIPSSLGKLTQLQKLDLSNNHFTGTIPAALGKLTKLTALKLDSNPQLTGCVPRSIDAKQGGICSSTTYPCTFDPDNRLRNDDEGTCNLPRNSFDLLAWQKMVHKYPGVTTCAQDPNLSPGDCATDTPCYCSLDHVRCEGLHITKLDLSTCGFGSDERALVGENISDIFGLVGGFTGLQELDLSGNELQGPFPQDIPSSFFTSMELLDLNGNNFYGSLSESTVLGLNYVVVNNSGQVGLSGNSIVCPEENELQLHASITCVNKCGPGRYGQGGVAPCSSCAEGKYGNASGMGECAMCDSNTYMPITGATECLSCGDGMVTNTGRSQCNMCIAGKYSVKETMECSPCPNIKGVECLNGILIPQDGHWAAASMLGDTSPFADSTEVFKCLTPGNTSCFANDDYHLGGSVGGVSPATAYNCSRGHAGALPVQMLRAHTVFST